jgi:hypothetical protein
MREKEVCRSPAIRRAQRTRTRRPCSDTSHAHLASAKQPSRAGRTAMSAVVRSERLDRPVRRFRLHLEARLSRIVTLSHPTKQRGAGAKRSPLVLPELRACPSCVRLRSSGVGHGPAATYRAHPAIRPRRELSHAVHPACSTGLRSPNSGCARGAARRAQARDRCRASSDPYGHRD